MTLPAHATSAGMIAMLQSNWSRAAGNDSVPVSDQTNAISGKVGRDTHTNEWMRSAETMPDVGLRERTVRAATPASLRAGAHSGNQCRAVDCLHLRKPAHHPRPE